MRTRLVVLRRHVGAIGLCTTFRRSESGTSALEFGIVAAPLIFTILAILQVGIFYMTQASLDAGLIAEADALTGTFLNQGTPTTPSASALKAQIAAKSGGLVNQATLAADVIPLKNLTAAPVAVGLYTPNMGLPGDVLAVRGQAGVISFAPFFGKLLMVRSSVLVRRQGQ